jgi:hypothetical protein
MVTKIRSRRGKVKAEKVKLKDKRILTIKLFKSYYQIVVEYTQNKQEITGKER